MLKKFNTLLFLLFFLISCQKTELAIHNTIERGVYLGFEFEATVYGTKLGSTEFGTVIGGETTDLKETSEKSPVDFTLTDIAYKYYSGELAGETVYVVSGGLFPASLFTTSFNFDKGEQNIFEMR